jgi:hypothetical protein
MATTGAWKEITIIRVHLLFVIPKRGRTTIITTMVAGRKDECLNTITDLARSSAPMSKERLDQIPTGK